ncbi:MAG: iron uptake porin, partial [Cyanobacteriota bacterium]|nr:iron uptake porin [Cyanobacteriota bacterium]
VTDELKRLMKEFEKELAVLRGRVDGLEARVGELEATQFSTTTRLRADTRWVLGAVSYSGNEVNDDKTYGPNSKGVTTQLPEALTFNYDVRLNFDTSFSGKDLLRTTLRAGNFRDSAFSSGNSVTPLAQLDAAFEEDCGTGMDCGDVVAINRLYYRFPIGSSFTAVVGPRFRQDDGLAVKPSVYTGDKILKYWDFNGAPGAYSQVLGAGGALWWKQPGKTGFSASAVYVSANGDAATPNGDSCLSYNSTCGGIGNSASAQTGTFQLAYTGSNWNITGAYTYNSGGVSIAGTPLFRDLRPNIYNVNGSGQVSSWGVSGYWQPLSTGWFPSISAGWGYNTTTYNGTDESLLPLDSAASQSWYVGLNWQNAFAKGNVLGFAVGQPTFVTALTGDDGDDIDVNDGNYAFELYYKFQVTDNIAVTPSLFWLSRARGALTNAGASAASALADPGISDGDTLGTFGGLIQTTFKF